MGTGHTISTAGRRVRSLKQRSNNPRQGSGPSAGPACPLNCKIGQILKVPNGDSLKVLHVGKTRSRVVFLSCGWETMNRFSGSMAWPSVHGQRPKRIYQTIPNDTLNAILHLQDGLTQVLALI